MTQEQKPNRSPHDVAEWKECSRCGRDYPITFHLDYCILHRNSPLVIKRREVGK